MCCFSEKNYSDSEVLSKILRSFESEKYQPALHITLHNTDEDGSNDYNSITFNISSSYIYHYNSGGRAL